MIRDDELREIIETGESDRVEFTISMKDTDKFSEAICAFANNLPNHNKPGYLVIGVNDDGTIQGAHVDDKYLQYLGGLRSDGNIQPLPNIKVGKYVIEEKTVAVVEVIPALAPPVRYKGRVYVRTGPRKAIASEQEEKVLTERRMSNSRSFDASAAQGSAVSDLSLDVFYSYRRQVIDNDVIDANHRTIEEQLAALRFFNTKFNCVTFAGILLFGKNPRYFLPGAYIQYLRIEGTSLADDRITDNAEISGDLLSVLRELDTRVSVNIRTSLTKETALTEKEVYDYPKTAVRELLMNAVLHRDYQSNAPIKCYWFDDRIEIHNPGSLYGVVTMETLDKCSDYRNPVIAETMKPLGYINKYGYGIQKAQSSLKINGSPLAEFKSEGNTFLAIIRKRNT